MRFLYKITNKINGKVYIGQTNNMSQRISDHKKPSSRSSLINRAFTKYGVDSFDIRVIAECSMNTIDRMEESAIRFFNSLHPLGYNYDSGGQSCKRVHSDIKEKLRQITIKQMSNPEARKIIGDANRGRKASEETRRKISLAGMGRHPSEATNKKRSDSLKGRKISEHAKQLISKANSGKHRSAEVKMQMSITRLNKMTEQIQNMTEKECCVCGIVKKVSDFFLRKTKNGIGSPRSDCKICYTSKGIARARAKRSLKKVAKNEIAEK